MPPRGAISRSPRRCAASPRRRCCRCSTPAPPAWAAGCCATGCTIRCATATRSGARQDAVETLAAPAAPAHSSRCATLLKRVRRRGAHHRAHRAAAPRARATSPGCATTLELLPALQHAARRRVEPAPGRAGAAGCAARRRCSTCSPRDQAEPGAVVREGGVIADGYRRRAGRTARDPERTAARSCSTWRRASARAPASPTSGRIQPRARLLHRGHARQRATRCRTTTAAARR